MGCINCKSKISEQATPYTIKKHSRWRLIVGIEAKGIEFNAQVGLVHIGDEKLELQNQPEFTNRLHQSEDQPEDRSITESRAIV